MLRFGKQAPVRFKDALYLKDVQAEALPKPKGVFGFGTLFKDWGMLGNDQVGDCAEAGTAHEVMLDTKVGGHPASFSTESVLGFYSEVTGYDPEDPNTDQGTQVVSMMDYRRRTGIADVKGVRHKIVLAVRCPIDYPTFQSAVYTFGQVGVGFNVPESAMEQFNAGRPWKYIGDHNIVGGHYVCGVGSMKPDSENTVVTWGRRQVMERDFFEAYVDELWVPLSSEIERNGKGLHALDWAKVVSLAEGL